MKFLQEINESRLYRTLAQVDGKTTSELAERLFLHLIALQIMHHETPGTVRDYATQVMSRPQFDGFRTSQPDLWNLISLLMNQDRYEYAVAKTGTITLPELRLKRILRDMSNGSFNNNDFSHMMLMLQQQTPNMNGQLVSLRRHASNWQKLSDSERVAQKRLLFRLMQEYTFNSDLHRLLKAAAKL